jgi:hypothetical protein
MTPSDPERLAEPLTEHPHPLVDEFIDTLAEHGYGILAKSDLDRLNAAVAERDSLTTRLAAAEERASFWETLHDERTESLEAERDRADG